jgi:hypothetical protein
MARKPVDCSITVNGQPLSEFIGEELAVEIEGIRVDVIAKITKSVVHSRPPKHAPGLRTGRKAGNPGVRKPRVFKKEEVDAENLRRGLIPFKSE